MYEFRPAGASILGAMTRVESLKLQGEKNIFEILYNVVQRPTVGVNRDQTLNVYSIADWHAAIT